MLDHIHQETPWCHKGVIMVVFNIIFQLWTLQHWWVSSFSICLKEHLRLFLGFSICICTCYANLGGVKWPLVQTNIVSVFLGRWCWRQLSSAEYFWMPILVQSICRFPTQHPFYLVEMAILGPLLWALTCSVAWTRIWELDLDMYPCVWLNNREKEMHDM